MGNCAEISEPLFQTDAEKAAQGPFQGLIAGGWYTASLMMPFLVRNFLSNASSLGSPGVDALRWRAPVRAGDLLKVQVSIVETRCSSSKRTAALYTH